MQAKNIKTGAGRTGLTAAALMTMLLGGCAITPQPICDQERAAQAAADRAAMFKDQAPITGPLTLKDASERALKYNLDARVKTLEEAVANENLVLSSWNLLPKVVANAGYTTRSNVEASSSVSVLSGRESLEPSTSTDESGGIGGLTLSWNILDFGASYYAAHQAADRTLIAAENRRKVIDNLLEQVRSAFWRAASAQKLEPAVSKAIKEAQNALDASSTIANDGMNAPIEALQYQKTLLQLLRQLEAVQKQMTTAKVELAALIDAPLGADFQLAVPDETAMRLDPVSMTVGQMEDMAMLRNPDVRSLSYETRITAADSRKALLKLLPGLDLSAGPQWDSNSFLVNKEWAEAAARTSWNLMSLVTWPETQKHNESLEQLVDVKREAVGMAILAKVHVAYLHYVSAQREYGWADRAAAVDARLYKQVSAQVDVSSQGDLSRISAEVSAVATELQRFQSYAEAQEALGQLYATLGMDATPDMMTVPMPASAPTPAVKQGIQPAAVVVATH
jgi:outer membrane protein TolC